MQAKPEMDPMTEAQVLLLAGSAVAKIDQYGLRGTTLCSTEEITAMALLIVAGGLLPGLPTDPGRQPLYPQAEKEKT